MNVELVSTLAQWAGRTSLEALPLALVTLLLARWRRLPTAWRWWLPALFFVRLAMPQVPEVAWRPATLPQPAAAAVHGAPGYSVITESAPAATERGVDWVALSAVIWASGVLAVTGWLIASQLRLRRSIARRAQAAPEHLQQLATWAAARMAIGDRVPVKVMPGWGTLAICGALRPVLLVPGDLEARFTPAQVRGMFLHEMAHVRRRDVLWSCLALGLCALHWFNPLAWLALRRFHADRELACDAAAVAALDGPARREYGEALLRCLEITPQPATAAVAPFFRHFPELKQRLQNIMHPSSPTPASRLLTALLVPALAVLSFTTNRAQADGERPPREGEKPAAERPAREGEETAKRGSREGEQPRRGERDGERPRPGARNGERPREGAAAGEQPRRGAREGDRPRDGAREGDGDRPRRGARDGEQPKAGPRDGERPREGARDGERPREGAREGERPNRGLRDGEQPKGGPRDGDRPREGGRDGDRPREGARDGDAPKAGPREGDQPAPGRKAGER